MEEWIMARRRAIRAAALAAQVVPWIVAYASTGGVTVSTPQTQTIRAATSDT
jgi:hypothetical protein